jgi:hypothetical protein
VPPAVGPGPSGEAGLVPIDDSGTGRFTIGITSQDGITYHHVHLSATQARRFVDFMDEST